MVKIKFRINDSEVITHDFTKELCHQSGYIDEIIKGLFYGEVKTTPPKAIPSSLADLSAETLIDVLNGYYDYVRNITFGETLLSPVDYYFGTLPEAEKVIAKKRNLVEIMEVSGEFEDIKYIYQPEGSFSYGMSDEGYLLATEDEVLELINYLVEIDRFSKRGLEEYYSVYEACFDLRNGMTLEGILSVYQNNEYDYQSGIDDDYELGKNFVESGDYGNIDRELYEYIDFEQIGKDKDYYYATYGAVRLFY